MAVNVSANDVVDILLNSEGILACGRKYGIRVMVTDVEFDLIKQTTHPRKDRVIGNIIVDRAPTLDHLGEPGSA